MKNNTWLHGPVPPSHPSAIVREGLLNWIADLIDNLSAYPAILAARQTGKTSLLYQLMMSFSDRYAFVFLDFQSWGDVESKSLYARILRQIVGTLPNTADFLLASNPQNAPDFQELLKGVVAKCQKERLVFLCDELGGMQHDVAILFATTARSIFTERLLIAEYGKTSFVFTGGIDLEYFIGASSPLANIVSREYLGDLDLHSVQKIASCCDLAALADAVFECTGGHPYLTQRVLSILTSVASVTSVEGAVEHLLQEGDTNITNLVRRLNLSSPSVKDVARRVLEGQEVRFSRIVPQIAQLELLGLVKTGPDGKCAIRNEIYKRALPMSLPTDEVTEEVHLLADTIPTGYCHNLTAEDFPLVEIRISNSTERSVDVHSTAVIQDYSIPDSHTFHIQAKSQNVIRLLPILDHGKVKNLTELTHAGMHVTVKRLDTGAYLHDEVYRVLLHARNTALLALIDPGTSQVTADLTNYLCAWVTPHAQGIEEILQKAAERHPDRVITGYQGGNTFDERIQIVRRQVQAIYEALQRDTEVNYINAPLSLGAQADQIMQRVRLPSETLKVASANCIDGTMLFASLLECIGINPVLVIVPGHAYVGWEVWPGSSQYEYLETTMVSTCSFETARQAGNSRTLEAQSKGDHQRPLFHPDGFWRQIDVGQCRLRKIMPIE